MRRRISNIGHCCAICGLIALFSAGTIFAETADRESAMRKGLDWLQSKQREDGSWSNPNFPALTALSMWAFARSDHPDREAVCEKAVAFILDHVQEDGGIYKPAGLINPMSGGLSTYNTAICLTALHAYDMRKYAGVILNARRFVAESQLTGDSENAGGFGYDKNPHWVMKAVGKGVGADLSNTSWAMMAMRETEDVEDLRSGGEKVDMDWQAALEFLGRLQDADKSDPENYGGFVYAPGSGRGKKEVKEDGAVKLVGFGSMTYAGLEAMIYAEVDRSDPRVQSTLQWAERHWSVEENPGRGDTGLFYYYNVLAKALEVGGIEKVGGDIAWRKELTDKLISLQREDGRWVNDNSRMWEGDAMLVTTYSILALQYAGEDGQR